MVVPFDAFTSIQEPTKRKGPPKKIIVIGAGLAGLSTAYELTQMDNDVTVLLAQMRSWGRVLTLPQPFADGLYVEGGATWIPDKHSFTLRYVNLFHLPLNPGLPSKLSVNPY